MKEPLTPVDANGYGQDQCHTSRRSDDACETCIAPTACTSNEECLRRKASPGHAAMAEALERARQARTEEGKQVDFVEISGEPLRELIRLLRSAPSETKELPTVEYLRGFVKLPGDSATHIENLENALREAHRVVTSRTETARNAIIEECALACLPPFEKGDWLTTKIWEERAATIRALKNAAPQCSVAARPEAASYPAILTAAAAPPSAIEHQGMDELSHYKALFASTITSLRSFDPKLADYIESQK